MTQLHVLDRIRRLRLLILFLSTICLIADITFSSLDSNPERSFYFLPIPLIGDIPTVIIFAYSLWGVSHPLLLPTSSPTSNAFSRAVRYCGNFILGIIWLPITAVYATDVIARKILAFVAGMLAILLFMELTLCVRVSREQRRVLTEQSKRAGSTEPGKAHASRTGLIQEQDSGVYVGDQAMDELELAGVEIVRPEAINPSTVIHNHQIMFEIYQQQYAHQYQQYFMGHQAPNEHLYRPQSGHVNLEQDGKYDDILQQSSFKFEVPMPSSGALESAPSTRRGSLSAVQPPSKAGHRHSTLNSSTQETQRPKSMVKEGLSPVEIDLLAYASPFTKEEYEAMQANASAPSYTAQAASSSRLSLQAVQSDLDVEAFQESEPGHPRPTVFIEKR